VPNCNWYNDQSKVNWYNPSNRNDNLRAREIVSDIIPLSGGILFN
jgi:hypothetical protein